MTPTLPSLHDSDFDAEVRGSAIPVLIHVTAAWCGPCRAQLAIATRVAARLPGRVRALTLDVESAPVIAARLGIRGVPTVVIFAGGREVARHVGLTPETILLRMLEPALAASAGVLAP